jgi:hypothetical protein
MKVAALVIFLALVIGVGFLLLRSKSALAADTNASGLPPAVVEQLNRDRVARELVRKKDPQFFAAVSNAMFQRDPIGINFKTNTDEYDAEAGTVIPRLNECSSSDEVATVLHQEFSRWFGTDTAGDRARYVELAKDIWALWQRHKSRAGA